MPRYTTPAPKSTTPPICHVNDYMKTINAILVQLLDKKDKEQTLNRLKNLKKEIITTLTTV